LIYIVPTSQKKIGEHWGWALGAG